MSAVISSEWSNTQRRGQMLAFTFSMQGWGQFFGALFDIILLAIFKGAVQADQVNLDLCVAHSVCPRHRACCVDSVLSIQSAGGRHGMPKECSKTLNLLR